MMEVILFALVAFIIVTCWQSASEQPEPEEQFDMERVKEIQTLAEEIDKKPMSCQPSVKVLIKCVQELAGMIEEKKCTQES